MLMIIYRAAVACIGANDYMGSEDTYGTPHIFFRVTLDHTIIIPQQLSCPSCKSSDQSGCIRYPDPTYREAVGTVVGPASGKGTIKILMSQASQTAATSQFLLTQLSMYLTD